MYCVDEITRFVELVVETTDPEKIILFCTDGQINHTLDNSNAIANALKKGRVMYERAN